MNKTNICFFFAILLLTVFADTSTGSAGSSVGSTGSGTVTSTNATSSNETIDINSTLTVNNTIDSNNSNITLISQNTGNGSNVSNTAASAETSNVSNDSSCNSGFYSSSRFLGWGYARPAYLSKPAYSNNLTYCKSFNNTNSCCDANTDQDIRNYYETYKAGLADISSVRMKKMKNLFEAYKNITNNDSQSDYEMIQKLVNLTTGIKNKWVVVNTYMVACAQAALKYSVGLLCQGCSTDNTANMQNNKLLLSKGSCSSLAKSCMYMIQALKNASNSSIYDAMTMVDGITVYQGEHHPTPVMQIVVL